MIRPARGKRVKSPMTLHPSSAHDRLIARLLSGPKKAEAMKWLRNANAAEERTIGRRRTTGTSARLVKKLYDFGACQVLAAQIHRAGNGAGQHTGKLVVELPKDLKRRRAIFEWCRKQGESLGHSPDVDQGQDYLFLLLD